MGVVRTLLDRCEKVVTEEDIIKEKEPISEALEECEYPHWTIILIKEKRAKQVEKKKNVKVEDEERNMGAIVIPFVKGLSGRIAQVMKKRRISTAMRPDTTLRICVSIPRIRRNLRRRFTRSSVRVTMWGRPRESWQ